MKVICFGAGRTGSTLIYNYVRELSRCSQNVHLLKTHNINSSMVAESDLVFVSIRHPIDSVCSMVKKDGNQLNLLNLNSAMQSLRELGLRDACLGYNTFLDSPKVCKLRYEDFYNNHEMILDRVTSSMNVKVADDYRSMLIDKYAIQNVIKYQQQYSSFGEYCDVTHIHGDHVSDTLGIPLSFRNELPSDIVGLLYEELRYELEVLGYSDL